MTVTFTYLSKTYTGDLSPVHGAAAEVYHLTVDKYYWGRLQKVNGRWVFQAQHRERDVIGDQLATYLQSGK